MPRARHAYAAAGAFLVMAALAGCVTGRSAVAWQARPDTAEPLAARSRLAGERCPRPTSRATADSLEVALPGSIDPANAPLPSTEAELHVFRNLYETLVRVDCAGDVGAGLAEGWASFDGGRVWVFVLRRGAAFWDGTPLVAGDVVASWQRMAARLEDTGEATPFIAFDPYGSAVGTVGADTLVITLPQASDTLPLQLVHPALAVTAGSPGGWPLGSGPCRPGEGHLVLEPNPHHPRRSPWSRVEVTTTPTPRRDFLVAGGDVLVLRDRAEIALCERTPGITVAPLPWDLLYLLLVPPADDLRPETRRQRWTTSHESGDLAAVAGENEARRARDLFFVDPQERVCSGVPPRVRPLDWPDFSWPGADVARDEDLVLYPAGFAAAGRIAEELAALAAVPRPPYEESAGRGPLTPGFPPMGNAAPVAVGVPPAEFAGAIQSARAGAYVVPWPRRYATACGQIGGLLGLAEWLRDASADDEVNADLVPPSARAADPAAAQQWIESERIARRLDRARVVVPLVVSRPFLATSAEAAGIAWDFDGALDLSGASE